MQRAAVASCRGEVTLPIGDDFRQKDASGTFVAVDAVTRAAVSSSAAGLGRPRPSLPIHPRRPNSAATPAASKT
jgi:hypothetical protein